MIDFVVLDEQGFIVYAGASNVLPENAVKTDGPVALPPVPLGHRVKFETMEVVDVRTDEAVWSEVRAQRSALLAQCDWCVMPDSPLTTVQVAAWRAYRQALRDITKQVDPRAINWPVAPTN